MTAQRRYPCQIGHVLERWFLALAITLFAIAVPATALAASGRPVVGKDYVQQQSTPGDASIRIWIKPEAQIYAPGLAKVFGTTPKKIRELNPQTTLAICYDPKARKTHKSDKVTSDVKTRETNEIWNDCAEENQWVYVYSGVYLTLPNPAHTDRAPTSGASTPEPPPKKPVVHPSTTLRSNDREKTGDKNPPTKKKSFRTPGDRAKSLMQKTMEENERLKGENAQLKVDLQAKDRKISQLPSGGVPVGVFLLVSLATLIATFLLIWMGRKLGVRRAQIIRLREQLATANASVSAKEVEVATLRVNLGQANEARESLSWQRDELERRLEDSGKTGVVLEAKIRDLEARVRTATREARAAAEAAFADYLERLRETMGHQVFEASDTSGRSEELLNAASRHFAKLGRILPRARELLQGEEEETKGVDPNDLLHLQLLGVAFGRIKGERDMFSEENVRLTAALREARDRESQALILQEAHAQSADEASALPGPTSGDHELRDLALSLAELDGGEEESCPPTELGIAPPASEPPNSSKEGKPNRVPTLTHGIEHAADLLLSGSMEREAFFRAVKAMNDIAVQVGGLKVFSTEEISTLRGLSKLPIGVLIPPANVQSVRLQDFADDARVVTFRPLLAL